jgi:hypothetical protein
MKKFLIFLVVVGAISFGVWQYWEVIGYYPFADGECLKWANELGLKIAFEPDPADPKIFVVSKWVKDRSVVVLLGQRMKGKTKGLFQSRVCVVSHGAMHLPSIYEQREWDNR